MQLAIADLFRLLCIQYRVVSIPYFLDEMQPWELDEILDDIEYLDAPAWERSRMQVHAQVASFSTKKLSPTDIMRFPWDRVDGQDKLEELPRTIGDDDIARLREKARKIETNKKIEQQ